MAAFKRGELLAARNLWTEIVNHAQASGRDKAVAYNNMAVSYCQNGDEVSCERMYAAMLRADRSYNVDAGNANIRTTSGLSARLAPGSRRDQLLSFATAAAMMAVSGRIR